jgi:hypothetical protein
MRSGAAPVQFHHLAVHDDADALLAHSRPFHAGERTAGPGARRAAARRPRSFIIWPCMMMPMRRSLMGGRLLPARAP